MRKTSATAISGIFALLLLCGSTAAQAASDPVAWVDPNNEGSVTYTGDAVELAATSASATPVSVASSGAGHCASTVSTPITVTDNSTETGMAVQSYVDLAANEPDCHDFFQLQIYKHGSWRVIAETELRGLEAHSTVAAPCQAGSYLYRAKGRNFDGPSRKLTCNREGLDPFYIDHT